MRSRGQSLSDYTLILALVALVAIGALAMLGDTLQKQFAQTISTKKNGTPPVTTVAIAPAPVLAPLSPLPPALTGATNAEFTNPDGSRFALANVPQDLPTLVETVGTDGTTKLYAQNLLALAEGLLESGQIDVTTAAQIRAIANAGFEHSDKMSDLVKNYQHFADTHGAIPAGMTQASMKEALIAVGGVQNAGTTAPQPVTFEAYFQNYLSQLHENPQASTTNILGADSFQKMLTLYRELYQSKKIRDPNVTNLIENALSNIGNVTKATASAGNTIINVAGPVGSGDFTQVLNSNLNTSYSNSTDICHAHQDNASTGFRCIQNPG